MTEGGLSTWPTGRRANDQLEDLLDAESSGAARDPRRMLDFERRIRLFMDGKWREARRR